MQVICSFAKECPFKCIGHYPHIHSPECEGQEGHASCFKKRVCIPVQSDFERGQEGLRQIARVRHYYVTTDNDAYHVNLRCLAFDSTSEKMPKGICRNCGHPKYTHYHWDDKCDYCDCKKFLAEPLAPTEKRKPSAVEETIIYWKESYEAGKADCAKTHEALRNEGRREVVEWFLIRFNDVSWGDLQAKKKEWGL